MPLRCSAVRLPSWVYIRPVDPLESTSRILDPLIIGEDHYNTAQAVKQLLQHYNELQDIIAIMGVDELSDEDKLVVAVHAVRSGSCRNRSMLPNSLPEFPV